MRKQYNLLLNRYIRRRETSNFRYGKAGQIAMNITTTFLFYRYSLCIFCTSEAQHGDLGILQKNDLLCLSQLRQTREIVELTQLAHNLDQIEVYRCHGKSG